MTATEFAMESNSRDRQILDGLNTAVLTFDGACRVNFLNPAGESLFGLSARRALGQHLGELLPDNLDLTQPAQATLETGQPFTVRECVLNLAPGRQVTVDCTVTPLGRGHGEGGLLMELAQVDRLLKLAREDKLLDLHAANQTVTRGLAHEIKNPLGGLRGAAQLLDRALDDRELKEYTRIIIHEADRLDNLVDRMMGSYQPFTRQSFNIHETLEHVRKLIEVEGTASLRCHREYDPSLPELEGDAEQIVQAILNIVRNAVQAIQGKGNVWLRTRIERQFTIGQNHYRQMVRIDIEDDGPGIPDGLREKIFYPMVTGRVDGTGLGLSIAQDIINRHGGLIEASRLDGRTRFTIYLPLQGHHEQTS